MTIPPFDARLAVPAPPGDDASIWRYSDFTKFVNLLETRTLFLPRVATLEDPFEGSFPTGQSVIERVAHMLPPGLSFRPDTVVEWPPGFAQTWPTVRTWSVVSCWHQSEYESAAMWQLYAPKGAAVAIRSSIGGLRRTLGNPPPLEAGFGGGAEFHIGRVEYIDYTSGRIPSSSFASQFFRKRLSFEHEREVRALLVRYPVVTAGEQFDNGYRLDHTRVPVDGGLRMPVDPAELIDAVRIAPQAPAWFTDLARLICLRYKLGVEPVQSELDSTPLY